MSPEQKKILTHVIATRLQRCCTERRAGEVGGTALRRTRINSTSPVYGIVEPVSPPGGQSTNQKDALAADVKRTNESHDALQCEFLLHSAFTGEPHAHK
jgi:hypothetical protein